MEPIRIVGSDVKTALRLVRDQLGAGAMILSNRRVAGGVEILAVPEDWTGFDAGSSDQLKAPTPSPAIANISTARDMRLGAEQQGYLAVSKPRMATVAPVAPMMPAAPLATNDNAPEMSALASLQSELRSVRSLLEQRIGVSGFDRVAEDGGVAGRIWRRLGRAGIPGDLAREIVSGIPPGTEFDAAWQIASQKLCEGLGDAGDLVANGGVFGLVGPSGAGKSTTICKLAVRHAMKHGAEGMALVSMDSARIGGSDLLRTVARLLDADFYEVGPELTLEGVLRQLRDKHLVLIDTAAINRRVRLHAERVEALATLGDRARVLLVMPANVQFAGLRAAIRDYAWLKPAACVVTKLDETRNLGELVTVLRGCSLPIAYATDGQEIPDDLRIASSAVLVANALMLNPGEDPTASAGPPRPDVQGTQSRLDAAASSNATRIIR